MLNCLESETRLILINSRIIAMQEGLEVAINELKDIKKTSSADQAAVDLLQAELYYLNNQSANAVNIFNTKLMPVIHTLPSKMQVTILHNKNIASLGRPTLPDDYCSDFYYLCDYRKLSGFDPWYSNQLMIAHDAVEEGKHYKALPGYWQHLLNTFSLGIWNAHANAYAILCKELITLNYLPKAAYCAILSTDDKLAKTISDCLISLKNIDLIKQTLNILLTKAQLLKHASVACKIIEGIQDEIPDEYVEITVNYLLKICSIKIQNPMEIYPIINAWEAIKSIAHRLSKSKSCEILNIITTHEWFNSNYLNRRYLVNAITNMTSILPKNKLLNLAKEIITLVKEKKSDFDYDNVVNLLCNIAVKDKKTKKYLREQLYPKNQPIDSILCQVAKYFDKKLKIEQPEESVNKISQNILLQVQKLKSDEEPKKVFDSYGSISKFDKEKKEKKIAQISANSSLQALIVNRHLLNSNHIDILVNAMVVMLKDTDNLMSNKIGLINAIIGLEDKLTKKQKQKIYEAINPLASSLAKEGSIGMSHKEASNPLNPFKMNDVKPEAVTGGALYALAYMEKSHPKIFGDKLYNIIKKALTDENTIIRKYAFWAVGHIPKLNNELLLNILFGTRDSDYETAIAAYNVILTRKDFNLPVMYWHLLFPSIYKASNSGNKKLRLKAALLSKKLFSQAPLEYKNKLKEVIKTLKSDICYSVRTPPKQK